MGAVGGSFLAARTHGADSLGMFQNTSHAPRLNFKKLGHLHIQNARGGGGEEGGGRRKKNPKGKQSSQRVEGASSTQRLMSCCGGDFVAKTEQLQVALRRGRAQVSVEQQLPACLAAACKLVLLLVEWGEWEEELELSRNGVRVSACSSCPAGVVQPLNSSLHLGAPEPWRKRGGSGGQSCLPYSDGEMGVSPVLIPPRVLPRAAWDPAR